MQQLLFCRSRRCCSCGSRPVDGCCSCTCRSWRLNNYCSQLLFGYGINRHWVWL